MWSHNFLEAFCEARKNVVVRGFSLLASIYWTFDQCLFYRLQQQPREWYPVWHIGDSILSLVDGANVPTLQIKASYCTRRDFVGDCTEKGRDVFGSLVKGKVKYTLSCRSTLSNLGLDLATKYRRHPLRGGVQHSKSTPRPRNRWDGDPYHTHTHDFWNFTDTNPNKQ